MSGETEAAAHNTTAAFNDAGLIGQALHLGQELLHHIFLYNTGELVVGTGIAIFYLLRRRHLMKTGRLHEPAIKCQHTDFFPSSEINPTTGEEFMDQRIRTFAEINMREEVPHEIAKNVTGYLHKALQKCTADSPIVYTHLKEVVPQDQQDTVFNVIETALENALSERLSDKDPVVERPMGPRERPVEMSRLYMLIGEEGRLGMQMRLMLIDPQTMQPGCLPDIRNVRVERDDHYVADQNDYLLDRLKTLHRVAALMREPEQQWINHRFRVSIPTGETEKVLGPFVKGQQPA